MGKRALLALILTASLTPFLALAQGAKKVPTLSVVGTFRAEDPEARRRVAALEGRLTELGWKKGRNLNIEYHWRMSDPARMLSYIKGFQKNKTDVIMVAGTPLIRRIKVLSKYVPIVFCQVFDPVAIGFVKSLNQPGGNMTGVATFSFATGAKWLEVLKALAPGTRRVGVMFSNKTQPYAQPAIAALKASASRFSMEILETPAHSIADIQRTIDTLSKQNGSALVVLPDTNTLLRRKAIIDRVAKNRLPAIYPFRYFAASGEQTAYGPTVANTFRETAWYVDRILRGSKPSDLPVATPKAFDLVINLKTAKRLGFSVPPFLLATAVEVIE